MVNVLYVAVIRVQFGLVIQELYFVVANSTASIVLYGFSWLMNAKDTWKQKKKKLFI
jgi:hypothetical protein